MSINLNPGIYRDPPLGGSKGGPLASVSEFALTSTAQTAVLTYNSSVAGNVWIGIYIRVATATTVVSVEVDYTDAGGAQTTPVMTDYSAAVGSYDLPILLQNVVAGQPITIKVTAGTANQVFASASITQG